MWMYPMLWVVLGSVALAVGTTMTLMPILEDNIAPRTAEVMGLFLGVGGLQSGLNCIPSNEAIQQNG